MQSAVMHSLNPLLISWINGKTPKLINSAFSPVLQRRFNNNKDIETMLYYYYCCCCY